MAVMTTADRLAQLLVAKYVDGKDVEAEIAALTAVLGPGAEQVIAEVSARLLAAP